MALTLIRFPLGGCLEMALCGRTPGYTDNDFAVAGDNVFDNAATIPEAEAKTLRNTS
jgi:hypothetical protein